MQRVLLSFLLAMLLLGPFGCSNSPGQGDPETDRKNLEQMRDQLRNERGQQRSQQDDLQKARQQMLNERQPRR